MRHRASQVLAPDGEPSLPPLTSDAITASSALCGVSVSSAEPSMSDACGIGPLALLLDARGRHLAVRVRVADLEGGCVHEFA